MDINLFFLDFETTGLNPYLNDIIEIAIKKYNEEDYYETLVKPKKLPPGLVTYILPHITNINGITDRMIQEKAISKSESLYKLLEYIESHSDEASPIYIVSHNGTSFDFIFFRRLLSELINKRRFTKFKKTIIERFNYIDSLLLAKRFLTEKVSQPNLCKKYGIVNEAEHRALGDINALEKLYICLCNSFSKKINKDEDYLIHHPEEVNQYLFV